MVYTVVFPSLTKHIQNCIGSVTYSISHDPIHLFLLMLWMFWNALVFLLFRSCNSDLSIPSVVTQGHSVFPADWQCPGQHNPSGIWQFHLLPSNMGHLDGKRGLRVLSQACLSHWNRKEITVVYFAVTYCSFYNWGYIY